jgi:hypothetical protein
MYVFVRNAFPEWDLKSHGLNKIVHISCQKLLTHKLETYIRYFMLLYCIDYFSQMFEVTEGINRLFYILSVFIYVLIFFNNSHIARTVTIHKANLKLTFVRFAKFSFTFMTNIS